MKTIEMKYDLGTRVWVVYILNGEVSVYEDKNKLYNTICEKMNEILEKVVKYGNEN